MFHQRDVLRAGLMKSYWNVSEQNTSAGFKSDCKSLFVYWITQTVVSIASRWSKRTPVRKKYLNNFRQFL